MTIPVTIAFIRNTTLLTDALCASFVSAQQVQITRDFAPIWGIEATCVFVPPNGQIPADAYQVWWVDHSTEVGAAGFHTDDGLPRSYIAVADDLANGMNWCVTTGHEVFEMLVDPTIVKTVTVGSTEYAYEVCDCCEDDEFGYWIAGADGHKHLMTDFATRAWFDPAGVGPFTFRGSVARPLQLAEGGYIGTRQLPDGPWQQTMADGIPGPRTVKAAGSRTRRRFGG